MKRFFILSLFVLAVACTTRPEFGSKAIPDNEKIMRYDAIHEMCMEDAHTIGFASAYFGHDAWMMMIRELKANRPWWQWKANLPYIPAK